jgi:hypothetical protein
MTDKPKQPNHEADISNANKGTDGTNPTYDKAQGNRGKQLDPAQQAVKRSSNSVERDSYKAGAKRQTRSVLLPGAFTPAPLVQ